MSSSTTISNYSIAKVGGSLSPKLLSVVFISSKIRNRTTQRWSQTLRLCKYFDDGTITIIVMGKAEQEFLGLTDFSPIQTIIPPTQIIMLANTEKGLFRCILELNLPKYCPLLFRSPLVRAPPITRNQNLHCHL